MLVRIRTNKAKHCALTAALATIRILLINQVAKSVPRDIIKKMKAKLHVIIVPLEAIIQLQHRVYVLHVVRVCISPMKDKLLALNVQKVNINLILAGHFAHLVLREAISLKRDKVHAYRAK